MRGVIRGAVAVALVMGTAGPIGPAAGAGENELSLLFSLSADRAVVTPVKGAAQQFRVRLRGVDEQTVWFSDRPNRDSGVWPTKMFTRAWDKGATFRRDPPNIAMVLHEPVGGTDTVVAVMTRPRYLPKKDELRARLRVLSEEEADTVGGRMGSHARRHDPLKKVLRADRVSLFIDSWELSSGADGLWASSASNPANVYRLYWRDGTQWRCVSAATANWQSVFSARDIQAYILFPPRDDPWDPASWGACDNYAGTQERIDAYGIVPTYEKRTFTCTLVAERTFACTFDNGAAWLTPTDFSMVGSGFRRTRNYHLDGDLSFDLYQLGGGLASPAGVYRGETRVTGSTEVYVGEARTKW